MKSSDSDWIKPALTVLAVMLGVSSAGTLVSLSKGVPPISAPLAKPSATDAAKANGLLVTAGPESAGMERQLGMLQDFLEPAGTPMLAAECLRLPSAKKIDQL